MLLPLTVLLLAVLASVAYAVYHILGFRDVGTGDEWMSGNLRQFEHAGGGLRHCVRRLYQAEVVKSGVVGRPIRCWAAPRHPVARFGEALFIRWRSDAVPIGTFSQ